MSEPEHVFLLLSNMRCGSTLAQFMLGELGDVSTDYEVKWKPAYAPHAIHLVVDEQTGSLKKRLLESIKPNRIIGSKLVFDPIRHTPEDYRSIVDMIDPEIRIIHIKRPYWEVVTSSLRGFIHMPTQLADASHSTAYQILLGGKEQSVAKSGYILRRKEIRIRDVWELLKILLANDLCALRLRKRTPYIRVSYAGLRVQLLMLCRHIGSRATEEKICIIIANPPLEKLPPMRYEGNFLGMKLLAYAFDAAFWIMATWRNFTPEQKTAKQNLRRFGF